MENLKNELTGRTFGCLKRAGFKSEKEVIEKYKEEGAKYFYKIDGFSKKCFDELEEYIKKNEKKGIEKSTKAMIKVIEQMAKEKEMSQEMISWFKNGVETMLQIQNKLDDADEIRKIKLIK